MGRCGPPGDGGQDRRSDAEQRVLLLTITGRKTRRERATLLLYLRDVDDLAIVASDCGTSSHPVRWLTLGANPEVKGAIRGGKLHVRAGEATGAEKRRPWDRLVEMHPGYDYGRRTDRRSRCYRASP